MARRLTDRQAEALRLPCAGRSRAQAARALGIAPKGVDALLHAIRTRLGVAAPDGLCRRGAPDIAAIGRKRDRPPG